MSHQYNSRYNRGQTSSQYGRVFNNQNQNNRNRITIPTQEGLCANDDKVLMEIEVQLESMKTLLQKNEQYSNKLRQTLLKINQKYTDNSEKLRELHQQKQDIQQKSNVNRYGYSSSYGANLYGHKIQGISFYQLENYKRLDCTQSFELMSKKNNKMLKQTNNFLNSCYSYDSNQVIDPKKREKIESFFEILPQIKDKFLKQSKQLSSQSSKMFQNSSNSLSPNYKEETLSNSISEKPKKQIYSSENTTQEFIENLKKEFITLLIFNFLDEQLEETRQKDQSNTNIKKDFIVSISSISIEDYFKTIISSNVPVYNWIDWIEFAKFGNLILNKYGATPILGYVEGLEIFSIFKQLYSKLGDSFLRTILIDRYHDESGFESSISNISQSPISMKKSKRNNKKNSKTTSQNKIRLEKNELNIDYNALNQQISEWTRQDDEKLIRAVQIFGEKRWGQVSTQLNGKEHTDIVQRWVKFLNPRIEKGRWSLREDLKLAILYEFYHQSKERVENKTWCLIADHFKNRTEVQIRERWCNLLDPKMKFTQWSKQEDNLLLDLGVRFQGQWAKISRELENKTDNQVLRRWKLLLSDRFNTNLIKDVDLSCINLRYEYLRQQGLLQDNQQQHSPRFTQNHQISQFNESQNDLIISKIENQELSQFLPQIKIEQTFSFNPSNNLFGETQFSQACFIQNVNKQTTEKQIENKQLIKQNIKFFTLKRDDDDMEIEKNQNNKQVVQNSKQIQNVPSNITSMPQKTKPIFKLIKLTSSLANQIRKDNNKRREKKKLKRKPAGYKQKALGLYSASQIDNTSTFRSNFDDDEDYYSSHSSMNFTEYQSDTNNDPYFSNTPSIMGLKQRKNFKKKLAPVHAISQSQIKMYNEDNQEDGYRSESEYSQSNQISEIPSK